jgi:hypothetical protein
MTLRDVTGRVSRWTLILHRDEQGFMPAAFCSRGQSNPEALCSRGQSTGAGCLTAGGSIHHIGYGSFRSPALRRCSEREALYAP